MPTFLLLISRLSYAYVSVAEMVPLILLQTWKILESIEKASHFRFIV
jgi:hypothetical protein